MKYVITNDKTREMYERVFSSSEDAYHWIVNHLDLSLNWRYDAI